jgi:hypothetical protein
MPYFRVGETVIVAVPIEVWRSDANNFLPNITINKGDEVTITNIRDNGNIEIDRVDPKYGCFLPTYFKKSE